MSCWPTLSRIQRASGISLLLGSESSVQRRSSAATRGLAQRRGEARVEFLVVGERVAQAREAERGRRGDDPVGEQRGGAGDPHAGAATSPAAASPSRRGNGAEQQQHRRAAQQVTVDHRRPGGALGEEHADKQDQSRRAARPRGAAPSRSPAGCRRARRASRGSLSIRSVKVHTEETTRREPCVRSSSCGEAGRGGQRVERVAGHDRSPARPRSAARSRRARGTPARVRLLAPGKHHSQ